MPSRTGVCALALTAAAGLAALPLQATAQTAPLQSRELPWTADSGQVHAKGGGAAVVYETVVMVPRAPWLRLAFGPTTLGGVIEEGSGAYLRITSLQDGAIQYLNAESLRQWGGTTAYFNGDAVSVELIAFPGASPSRVTISGVTAGNEELGGVDSLCGADNRVLSTDPRSARHMPEGCSTWLFNDTNRMFLTAGHCGVGNTDVQQFNVPLSLASGQLVAPPPEDQYVVDAASVRTNGGAGIGNDYAYFGCFPNSNTGLTPHQRQQAFYSLPAGVPPVSGETIRITGYGLVTSPVSQTWRQVQKTHSGIRVSPTVGIQATTISYQVDTTGGNSGSAVEVDGTGIAIGIHTHGGCSSASGNNGTSIMHTGLQNFLASPQGVCRSGLGTPGGDLFAVGDAVNNIGTLNPAGGNFARTGDGPSRSEGMAYDPASEVFYVSTNDTFASARRLFTITLADGTVTQIGEISGTPQVINGLAFDAASGTLYGISQATGQVFAIDRATASASPVGMPGGGSVGGLEFDAASGMLLGIDDSGGTSTLVSIDPATGVQTLIGALGAGIADCNGLGMTADGALYTVNAANDQLLRIERASGAATAVGATGGLFGASFGIAAVIPGPACYANCDQSSASPVLNVADFTCFLARFAAGESYANCDGSTAEPVLNVADFTCFLTAFSAGCR